MQPSTLNLTKQHIQLLSYTDTLFLRWSLRRNIYLSKHIKSNLQIPLFILAEERRIAQITQSQTVIVQALKMSQFVEVFQDSRIVRLVQFCTVRVGDQGTLALVQILVKQYLKEFAETNSNVKTPQYITSSKTEDGYYYLTLKQSPPNSQTIPSLIQAHNKSQSTKISFTCQPLYQDIKDSISKIRKSKQQTNKYNYNNSYNSSTYSNSHSYSQNRETQQLSMPMYSRQNMLMMYPGMYYQYGMMPQQFQQGYGNKSYGLFIRKAVQSSDQDKDQHDGYGYNEAAKQQEVTKYVSNLSLQPNSSPDPQPTQSSTKQKKYQPKQSQPQSQPQPHSSPNPNRGQGQRNNKKGKKNGDNVNVNSNSSGNNQNKNVLFDDSDFPTIG